MEEKEFNIDEVFKEYDDFQMREFDTFMKFAEWTSTDPWRMLPFDKPTHWAKITNNTDDRWFGKKFTTEELFRIFKEEIYES